MLIDEDPSLGEFGGLIPRSGIVVGTNVGPIVGDTCDPSQSLLPTSLSNTFHIAITNFPYLNEISLILL